MITPMTTKNLWKRSLSLRLLFKWTASPFGPSPRKSFHSCSVLGKRRGSVINPQLPELIIDKPPNYYASLQQKLERINYYDILNEVDIGYKKDSKCVANFLKTIGNIRESAIVVEGEGEDDLLDLEEKTSRFTLSTEEYQRLNTLHSFTTEHLESTRVLANHFAIFRDLFFKSPVSLQTDRLLIEANARSESCKLNLSSQQATFSFLPLVPINAQFHLEDGDDVFCQTAYRGNLILPEYGANPPTVVINSAAINDVSTIEDLIPLQNHFPVSLNSGKAKADPNFYSLALVNLDSHFSDSGVCHWMLSNIHTDGSETTAETIVKYLPVYGIRGFGYHRFAFVAFKHNKALTGLNKVDDFDLGKRKFNGLDFMHSLTSKDNGLELTPVGLSWFQTTWNENCQDVFYNYLHMRSPTYEYIYPKQTTEFNQLQFPGRAPFNLYLDNFRDPKELTKEVLIERLKSINPLESYETEKMYSGWEGKPKLPHIHPISKETPDWYKSTIIKKRAQSGRWRGLRPVSAILPHDNNADLDNPKWPRISADKLPLNCPNPYPDGQRRPKPLRDTLWSKPLPDHHSIRINHTENLTGKDKEGLEIKSANSKV